MSDDPYRDGYTFYMRLQRPGEDDRWLKPGVAIPRQGERGFYLVLGNIHLASGQELLLLPANTTPDSTSPL